MKNEQLFERAQRSIPAGVNSPVRAFRSVGGVPPFFERAQGAHLWDADGKRYIDYVGSWGPMLVGHTHPAVVEAVQAVLGAPRDLQDVVGLAGLAVFERHADPRGALVVPGGLDEQPARVARTGLGDRAL